MYQQSKRTLGIEEEETPLVGVVVVVAVDCSLT
jgi:hypothetical protein